MISLLLVCAIAAIVVLWTRGRRQLRLSWLSKVALPGRWRDTQATIDLVLAGELESGSYRWTEAGRTEQGRWRSSGQALELLADNGVARRYDLRFFDAGQISLAERAGRAIVFQKVSSRG